MKARLKALFLALSLLSFVLVAAQDDIELYVIGFGISKGSTEEQSLKNMTHQLGGSYLSAENASSSKELESALTVSYRGPLRNVTMNITVGPSGCNFTRIQDAINASIPGDTILVQSGTYPESVNVTRRVTLKGINTGGGKPIIEPEKGNAMTLSADGVKLEGFMAVGPAEAGIEVNSKDNVLVDNAVIKCFAGIALNRFNNTLRSNHMSGNEQNFWPFNLDELSKYGLPTFRDFCNDIDTSNFVDGKPIYYLVNTSDKIIDSTSNAGNIYCIGCQNITVKDLAFRNKNGVMFIYTSSSRVQKVQLRDGFIFLLFSEKNSLVENEAINSYLSLQLSEDNLVLDNHVINGDGIILGSSNNNTIMGNNASNNQLSGITLSGSNNNTLKGNTASNNLWGGIHLVGDDWNNSLNGNTACGNMESGILIEIASNNNTVDGNDARNNKGSGIKVEGNCGNNTIKNNNVINNTYNGIVLISSENNSIKSNNACSNLKDGINFYQSNNNDLEGNNASGNQDNGIISIYNSSNNLIAENKANNNENCGINQFSSGNNIITGNTANNNNYMGIFFYISRGNTVTSNIASDNQDGIFFDRSSANTITANAASGNQGYGIILSKSDENVLRSNSAIQNKDGIHILDSKHNILYQNNLLDNSDDNAYDDTGENQWSKGYIGNRYSDFDEPGEGCSDSDNNGRCDAGYPIPGSQRAIDLYPLASKSD